MHIEIWDNKNGYWTLTINGEDICSGYFEDLIEDLDDIIEEYKERN